MTAAVVRRQGPAVRGGRFGTIAPVSLGVLLLAVAAWWVIGTDDESGGAGLGPVTGGSSLDEYTIVYETRYADGDPVTERLQVQRPFRSWVTSGSSHRATDAGTLSTSSDGGRWLTIEVPIATAGGDLRPYLVLDQAVADGLIEALDRRTVGGRECLAYRLGGPVSAGTLTPVDTVPGERADICVDDLGLVLHETWWIDDEVARTRVAVEIDIGATTAPERVPDDAVVLPFEDGGGAVEVIDPEADPGFVEHWRPGPLPPGFVFVDRWAVVPPALEAGGPSGVPRSADLALVTDAWRRGPDLLVIDQGAADPGVGPPWDEDAAGTRVELGEVGSGTIVLDLRMSEVRIRRPDDGFVRVAGTLPPEDLVAIARTLTRDGPGGQS